MYCDVLTQFVCVCVCVHIHVFNFMLNQLYIYIPFFIGSAESVTVNTNGSVVSGLMMWHNSTHCSGDEEQFIDCPAIMRHQFQKCSSSNYVGVKCEKLKGIIATNILW